MTYLRVTNEHELVELFQTHFRYRTYRMLSTELVNGVDTEDVLQDAFLRCLVAVRRGEKIKHLGRYAWGVLTHVCAEFQRAACHRNEHIAPAAVEPAAVVDLDARLIAQERLAVLEKAMKKLEKRAPMYRRGVELLKEQGCYQREIEPHTPSDRMAKWRAKAELIEMITARPAPSNGKRTQDKADQDRARFLLLLENGADLMRDPT
jgi:RNA polymerase sigma factor (sigma-70 family)